jgi:PhzF family phenazine biosynthesis protein
MPLAHLTLPTREVENTAAFFEKTLGYARGAVPGNSPIEALWLDLGGGQQLHVFHVEGFEVSRFEHEFGRHVAVFHPRADFAALKQRLIDQGAELIDPIRPTPFDRFFFREPVNGYVLEVIDQDVAVVGAIAVRVPVASRAAAGADSIPIVLVDAFADAPFTGNPAAVCVLPAPAGAGWMQSVAREMNLSETAFLVPRDDGFDLRWFTPAVEVDLCGHATLASAHVLWESGYLPVTEPARFHTRSGLLTAERRGDDIELDFPATAVAPAQAPDGLADALGGARIVSVGRGRLDYLIELEHEAAVSGLRPDFARLRTLPVRGVIVTSRASTPGWDVVSRFFAPGSGIDEDPVTGSAHCCLAPFWTERLGKAELVARQLSARGGTIHVRLDGDRVRLRGRAVTVLRGEWQAHFIASSEMLRTPCVRVAP